MPEKFTIGELAVRWVCTPSRARAIVSRSGINLDRTSVLAFERTRTGQEVVLKAIRYLHHREIESLKDAAGEDCGPRADLDDAIHARLWPQRPGVRRPRYIKDPTADQAILNVDIQRLVAAGA